MPFSSSGYAGSPPAFSLLWARGPRGMTEPAAFAAGYVTQRERIDGLRLWP